MSLSTYLMLVSMLATKKWRNDTPPKGAIKMSKNVHRNCTTSVRKKSHLNGFRHMKVIRHTRATVKHAIGLLNKNSNLSMKARPAKHNDHTTNIKVAVYIRQ